MTPEREVGRSRHQTADKNRETNSCLHGRHYCQEHESASLWCVVPQGLRVTWQRGRRETERRKSRGRKEEVASEAAPTRLGHVEQEIGFYGSTVHGSRR